MFNGLSLLLVLACLLPAAGKLSGQPRMRAAAAHFGIAWERYQLIGVAELAAAAGVLAGLYWRPLGVAAAVAFGALLLGAAITHVRAGDHARELVPALAMLAIVAAYLAAALPIAA
jgi:hypothetical protein